MTRSPEDVLSSGHVCAVPVSDEQLWEMTAGYLAEGLAAGQRVLYYEDGTVEAVLARLTEDRVPVRGPIADGQLAIVPTEQTRAAMRWSDAELEQLLATEYDESMALGYTGMRLTVQASGALVSVGADRLAEVDSVVDRVVRARPAAEALCLFDHRRFPDAVIDRMRAQHRVERVAPAIYDDNLLRITNVGPCAARIAGEVDHSNRPRIRRLLETTLDEALRSHSAPTDIRLDLASLRFIDVAGAVGLVHAAEEFPSTHRLVLVGVRPGVLRLLDRCGAPFAAQLRVEPQLEVEPPGPHTVGVSR